MLERCDGKGGGDFEGQEIVSSLVRASDLSDLDMTGVADP